MVVDVVRQESDKILESVRFVASGVTWCLGTSKTLTTESGGPYPKSAIPRFPGAEICVLSDGVLQDGQIDD